VYLTDSERPKNLDLSIILLSKNPKISQNNQTIHHHNNIDSLNTYNENASIDNTHIKQPKSQDQDGFCIYGMKKLKVDFGKNWQSFKIFSPGTGDEELSQHVTCSIRIQ
jgi:hypothetical protein